MKSTSQYFLFYKPFQVLSQFSSEGDKETLANYLKEIAKDVYPVGRLDYDSEGLLFLTNDKAINHRLLNPQFLHEREYWSQVEGIATEEKLVQLRKGVVISAKGKTFKTLPAKATLLAEINVPERKPPIRFRKEIPTSWISLTIQEGKNRQVRKMTAAVGLPTLRLLRYRVGEITLSEMQPGSLKEIGIEEVQKFFK